MIQNQQKSQTKVYNFDIRQEGIIFDAQYDFYGKRLATCSSEGLIHIFDLTKPDNIQEITSFGPKNSSVIWRIQWCNPRFGNIIASCSFDKKVILWKEYNQNDWKENSKFEITHKSSVNSISWAPAEYGLTLASCGSDGQIAIYSRRQDDDTWSDPLAWDAHSSGINAVVWKPFSSYEYLSKDGNISQMSSKRRLASGSQDKSIKFWEFDKETGRYKEILCLQKSIETNNVGHQDWVRDLAWSPALNDYDLIVSCSEDKGLIFWKIYNLGESNYTIDAKDMSQYFQGPVWRVEFSLTGSTLSASSANSNSEITVQIFKEDDDEEWQYFETLEDQNN